MRPPAAVLLFASLAVAETIIPLPTVVKPTDIVPMPTVVKPTDVVPMPTVIFPTTTKVIPMPTIIPRQVTEKDPVVPLPSVIFTTTKVVPMPTVIQPIPGPACTGGSFEACFNSVKCPAIWPQSCYCEKDIAESCAKACRVTIGEIKCPEIDTLN